MATQSSDAQGGHEDEYLGNANQLGCPNCDGAFFECSEDMVDSDDVPATDANYEALGGTDLYLFRCGNCGHIFSRAAADWETAQ